MKKESKESMKAGIASLVAFIICLSFYHFEFVKYIELFISILLLFGISEAFKEQHRKRNRIIKILQP